MRFSKRIMSSADAIVGMPIAVAVAGPEHKEAVINNRAYYKITAILETGDLVVHLLTDNTRYVFKLTGTPGVWIALGLTFSLFSLERRSCPFA